MNNIYIPHEDGKSFEKCYLLEPSKQYKDCILEEIVFNQELISELKEMQRNKQNQFDIDIDNEIEKIVKKAKKEKSKELNYVLSNNKKLKGIKKNRAVEKEINRENEAFEIAEETKNADKVAEVIELPSTNKELGEKEITAKDRLMEKLRKKRDERREKQ